ncbi:MAG: Hpt domain-containing protein [Coraliomargaritaceae bacterium]
MSVVPEINGVEYDRTAEIFDSTHFDGIFDPNNPEGRKALLLEIFGLFLVESGSHVASIERFTDSDGEAALREMVHSISGSAANLGLSRLAALCRGIEAAILEARPFDLEACRFAIRAEYEAACSAFSSDSLLG